MQNKTILLVEDNPNDVLLTERAFKQNQFPCQVVVASDGAEALDYMFATGNYSHRKGAALPDLILLDLKLPEIDGIEVLRHLKSNRQTKLVPVIVLTTSKEEQDLFESYDLGCSSYICKPINFNEFLEVARQIGLYWLRVNESPPHKRMA